MFEKVDMIYTVNLRDFRPNVDGSVSFPFEKIGFLIHCKDCIHCQRGNGDDCYCRAWGRPTDTDGYCHKGAERPL